jgi:hypothetical protein
MKRISTWKLWILLGLFAAWSPAAICEESIGAAPSASFKNPAAQYRPLQIVHGLDGLVAPKFAKHPLDKKIMD